MVFGGRRRECEKHPAAGGALRFLRELNPEGPANEDERLAAGARGVDGAGWHPDDAARSILAALVVDDALDNEIELAARMHVLLEGVRACSVGDVEEDELGLPVFGQTAEPYAVAEVLPRFGGKSCGHHLDVTESVIISKRVGEELRTDVVHKASFHQIVRERHYCQFSAFCYDTCMPDITREDIEHIAKLARIKLTEEEKAKLTGELGAILTYVSKLNEIDTKGVEPTAQVTGLENVFRKDEATPWYEGNPHDLVEAAPEHDGEYVKVKGVMADK